MKKLSTLFKKDINDLGRVIDEVNPENEWVFEYGIPTQKYDGTSCAIINGELYKRYDAKINKKTGKYKPIPEGSISCQEPDPITGHHPHWVKCDRNNNADKYHFEGFDNLKVPYSMLNGTYELCGPKIQGNPEKFVNHNLVPHGQNILCDVEAISYDNIKDYLTNNDIEGIVFHNIKDDKMCKIRKSDFGIKR